MDKINELTFDYLNIENKAGIKRKGLKKIRSF